MINALKIFGFTIVITLFYSYVGQMVPQKITYPPAETELGADMTADQLAEVGEEIASDKGTCFTCHTVGETGGGLRFPDLGGIGSRAGSTLDGYSDVDYLAESLYEPNTFVVPGFNPGMPAAHRPPISLNDGEIIAVIAYLQSLGATPTVTLATETKFTGSSPVSASGGSTATAAASAGGGALDGAGLYNKYLCATCHSLDGSPMVGPSLSDAGTRFSKAEIYEAIMDPDAAIAQGFPPGVMTATLQAMSFNDTVTSEELKTLVDYLFSMKG